MPQAVLTRCSSVAAGAEAAGAGGGAGLSPHPLSIATANEAANHALLTLKLRFKEIQRAAPFPTHRLAQDRPRLIPNMLRDQRLFRRVAAFQRRRLREPQHPLVVMAAKVVLVPGRLAHIEVA